MGTFVAEDPTCKEPVIPTLPVKLDPDIVATTESLMLNSVLSRMRPVPAVYSVLVSVDATVT